MDERFGSFDARFKYRVQLHEILDSEFARRSTTEWVELFTKHQVPCAPVNSIEDALRDPQVLARELVFYIDHPTLGSVGQVRGPVRFGSAGPVTGLAPALGADTRAVLCELLGYDPHRVENLFAAGVVAG